MAHYALINNQQIVVQVITGVDENVIQFDDEGNVVGGSTQEWEKFYESRPWFAGLRCIRTSYNGKIRKNFAGVGFTYNPDLDAFINPKQNCHSDEYFDEQRCLWICVNEEHRPTL